MTPYENLTGQKPTLKHVCVFGCAAFVYEHAPNSKLHALASPSLFLGCNDNGLYTVERLLDKNIINSVHVTFDERSFPVLDQSSGKKSSAITDDSPDSSILTSIIEAFEDIYSSMDENSGEENKGIYKETHTDETGRKSKRSRKPL